MTGPELRQVRDELGWNSTDLAAALGVTAVSVWRWETDRQPVPRYIALALDALRARQRDAA